MIYTYIIIIHTLNQKKQCYCEFVELLLGIIGYSIVYYIVCADVRCKTNRGKRCSTAAAMRMQNRKTYILLCNMY